MDLPCLLIVGPRTGDYDNPRVTTGEDLPRLMIVSPETGVDNRTLAVAGMGTVRRTSTVDDETQTTTGEDLPRLSPAADGKTSYATAHVDLPRREIISSPTPETKARVETKAHVDLPRREILSSPTPETKARGETKAHVDSPDPGIVNSEIGI